jgi:hypothetical protein
MPKPAPNGTLNPPRPRYDPDATRACRRVLADAHAPTPVKDMAALVLAVLLGDRYTRARDRRNWPRRLRWP